MIKSVPTWLQCIQSRLDFRDWYAYPQFSTRKGLGRVALIAFALGTIFGVHLLLLIPLILCHWDIYRLPPIDDMDPTTVQMLIQWVTYVLALSFFHLAEFFVTAIYNPSVTNGDSFMVNHSEAYTLSALTSWLEFWIRFKFFPSVNNSKVAAVGLLILVLSQTCRSLAMKTCGESFNHLIQHKKKYNHVLVTHGIYKYLRHPSYVGFYYWSVSTQLLLCNPICSALYSVASWTFFSRRIPYEEGTLIEHFPNEYPEYMAKSWIGIPFVRSAVVPSNNKKM